MELYKGSAEGFDAREYGQGFTLEVTKERSVAERLWSGINVVVAESPAVASRIPEETTSLVNEFFAQVGNVQVASEQVVASGQLLETYGVPKVKEIGLKTLDPAARLAQIEAEKVRLLLEAKELAFQQGITATEVLQQKRMEIEAEIEAISVQIQALIAEIEQEKISKARLEQMEVRKKDEATVQQGIRAHSELIPFKEAKIEQLRQQRADLRDQLTASGRAIDEMRDAQALVTATENLVVSREALVVAQN